MDLEIISKETPFLYYLNYIFFASSRRPFFISVKHFRIISYNLIVLGITYKDKYKRKMILMKQDWVKPNYADLAKQFNFNCKTVKKFLNHQLKI